MKRLGLLILASVALPAIGAESLVLIPTLYSGPGAFGTTWYTSVLVANYGPVAFDSEGVEFWIGCPIPEGCNSDSVPAFQYGAIVEPRPAAGLVLRAEEAVLANLGFNARLEVLSPNGGDLVELPIVREPGFSRSPLRFPYVTLTHWTAPKRVALRVYGPDAIEGTRVRVEVGWGPGGTPLASRELQLTAPPQPAGGAIFPAYAQIMLDVEFPAEQLGGTTFDLAVVPLPLPTGEIPRIWGYVSTTDNATQQVVLHTPQ